jgi:hypothetical protein
VGIRQGADGAHGADGRDLTSVALFDLRSNCGIGGFKGRLRPRGAASGDAKEREQDEENANCSPIVGHRIPIRVSPSRSIPNEWAARKRSSAEGDGCVESGPNRVQKASSISTASQPSKRASRSTLVTTSVSPLSN